MNRSHKMQLENLKSKNEYTRDDLETAEELLKQPDPPFHKDVQEVVDKIKKIFNEKYHEEK